jgi:N-methylhydantoinase B/oxoprolinase/acetone carboxylase alpha subunit
VKQRIEESIAESGVDAFISTLRRTLEDTRAEVGRRLRAWPDATVRSMVVADSTLRENALIKIHLELRKKGDELVFDFRGSSPEILNRATNTVLASLKGMLTQLFLNFVWPDLPRTQAAFAPIKVLVDEKSALNSSYQCPNAQSMMTFFPAFTAAQVGLAKFLYSSTERYTDLIAPWYNMINTFIYGGLTQYGELVGNLCADLNGMGGGAHPDRDGEHAIAPIFCAMADLGEQEVMEQEVPFMQIVSKRLMRDNQAFGKYRGGMGFQVIVATKDSPMWGFMTTCIGSKLPNVPGLFGGYGSPTYPLCKVKGVDVYDMLRDRPDTFRYSIEEIMNERPWPEAKYTTHHMGMQFELAKRGELYMISQGSGGGYGDVLDRDPALVVADLDQELISDWTAQEIYRVVYDAQTRIVDAGATVKARDAARKQRMKQGVPFAEFVKGWSTETPPAALPFFGSWNDRNVLYAGSASTPMPANAVTPVMMADPKDVRIAALEAKLEALQPKASAGQR